MKSSHLVLFLVVPLSNLMAQSDNKFAHTLIVESYVDFTSDGNQFALWSTYDHNKLSIEARYGYDWQKAVSLYAGPLLKFQNWKVRLLSGVTLGNGTGISFSPTAVLDARKFYLWNQAQYVIGISSMPSNFSHWGEFYYKISKWVWAGITDRYYTDERSNNFGIGPQLLLTCKDWFITFYWWVPLNRTEYKYYLEGGYERDF